MVLRCPKPTGHTFTTSWATRRRAVADKRLELDLDLYGYRWFASTAKAAVPAVVMTLSGSNKTEAWIGAGDVSHCAFKLSARFFRQHPPKFV